MVLHSSLSLIFTVQDPSQGDDDSPELVGHPISALLVNEMPHGCALRIWTSLN